MLCFGDDCQTVYNNNAVFVHFDKNFYGINICDFMLQHFLIQMLLSEKLQKNPPFDIKSKRGKYYHFTDALFYKQTG